MRETFLIAAILMLCTTAIPYCAAAAPAGTQKKTQEQQQPRDPEPTILSIIPAQGAPGTTIVLYGSSFTPDSSAYLGAEPVPTNVSGPRQLEFDIPDIAPGLYALYVKKQDGSVSRTYSFSVTAPRPVAASLSTDRVYACATAKDREVTVSGKNFAQTAQVLFNGGAVRTAFQSAESVSFIVPPLTSGLHQVQVKNSDDAVSGSLALFIDPKPEIRTVSRGDERVSDYDLIIEGINFQQGSALVVDGRRIFAGTPTDRDRIQYVDCTKIIYERHPYDTVGKNIRIQVVNPNNEESVAVQVNAP